MEYSAAERERGQRAMIREGVFSRIMEGVTGGVVLAGFAIALGANDLQIGLVAAIPFLAQLAHIPAVALVERYQDRRPLVVTATILSRSVLFIIALIPLLWGDGLSPVAALIPLLVAYAILATLAGAGWQVWVRSLVPRERLGSYFGRRMGILSFVGLVTLLAAGQVVSFTSSRWPDRVLYAYGALFALGGLVGLVSSAILATVPSVPSPVRRATRFPRSLLLPMRDENYRSLLVFLGAWGFAANIALPFVSVVLLRTLGYSLLVVTLLSATSQLANIAGLRLWAPLTDRYGNKPVLGLAASVFLVGMLLWAVVPKYPGTGVLVAAGIVHVFLGFALAGLDVASHNVTMKLAPEDEAPAYLASASVVKAVAAGVAPLLGGIVAMLLAGREYRFQFAWATAAGDAGTVTYLRFGPYDLLFLSSVVLGLYAAHRLLGFREEGEVPPETVARAMRRDVPQISSIAGLRTFAHVASYMVETAYRFEKAIVPHRPRRRGGHGDEDDDEPPSR